MKCVYHLIIANSWGCPLELRLVYPSYSLFTPCCCALSLRRLGAESGRWDAGWEGLRHVVTGWQEKVRRTSNHSEGSFWQSSSSHLSGALLPGSSRWQAVAKTLHPVDRSRRVSQVEEREGRGADMFLLTHRPVESTGHSWAVPSCLAWSHQWHLWPQACWQNTTGRACEDISGQLSTHWGVPPCFTSLVL